VSDLPAIPDNLALVRAELEVLRARIAELEVRLDRGLAAEKAERQEEIHALREEWRNISVAISANSTAVANAANVLQAELREVRETQKFQSNQLGLIGQAMDLLLKESGLAAVVSPND